MSDNVKQFKQSLSKNHLIYTFIVEHEIILDFLDKLDILNRNIQNRPTYEVAKNDIEILANTISMIIDAELHHQREEKVLFIELEKKGVIGPPKVMRWEHHELRQLKHEIRNLSINADIENFEITKKSLNFAVFQLVNDLREHIFKENNILYPMAINCISDNEWNEMKKECDKIGYCSFTPSIENI